jgi:hypothetical protein
MGEDNPERVASVNYLRSAVGEVLAQAFAELAVAQPNDPIQFLGGWLNKYVEAQRVAETVAAEQAALEQARVEYQAAEEAKRKIEEEKQKVEQAKVDTISSFTKDLEGRYTEPAKEGLEGAPLDPFEPVYRELVDKAELLTGARGIYLARVDGAEAGEGIPPRLHYTHAAKGKSSLTTNIVGSEHDTHEFMLDVAFTQEEGKLAVWSAFEAEAEETAEGEEEKPAEYKPLHIKDVMDDERIQFVSVTRLGELLILPIVYTNCLNLDAVTQAMTFMDEKATAVEEARVAYEAAVEAAQNLGEEEEAPEMPPTPEEVAEGMKEPALTGTAKVCLALCIDTLGTEQQLSPNEVELLTGAIKAVTGCRHRYDTYSVWQQAQATHAAAPQGEEAQAEAEAAKAAFVGARDAAAAGITEEADKAKAALAPEPPADGEEAPAEGEGGGDADVDRLQLAEAKAKYEGYTAFLETQKEALLAASQAVVPEVTKTAWAAASLFAGVEHTKVVHRGTGTPNWEDIRLRLPELLDAIKASDPAGPRTGLHDRNKLAFYKPMIETLDLEGFAEEAKLQPFLLFVVAAVAYREADIKVRMGGEPDGDEDMPEPVAEEAPAA